MEATHAVKDRINLTEKEEKFFGRLLDVVRHFKLETRLRVAGGWVRDKLLGKDCYDIDIALDNMLGRDFCENVNEYLKFVGEEQQGIGVIQCNPDQSKHLETARMRICDTWIDFVNLRSETYAENSRIPTMKFGTAEEDAYRRDLTINRSRSGRGTRRWRRRCGRWRRRRRSCVGWSQSCGASSASGH